jgi:hypothetical protein
MSDYMFHAELEVLPGRTRLPAIETGHVEQHAQFSVLPGESLELRHKMFVIRFFQFTADLHINPLAAVFFFELNRHCDLFLGQTPSAWPGTSGYIFSTSFPSVIP